MAASRRSFLALSVVSLAAPALVRAARGGAPAVTLKLHHASSSVSCVHANFLVPWARAIEAQSAGRIRIDIFPSMQLGGRPGELFDQAGEGIADIVWAMPSRTPGRFPKTELFELPFVPPRRALVGSKAIQEFAGQFLQDEFREFQAICFCCADRGILHAARPIETVAELSGLRLDVRTRLAGQAVQALGGDALPVPRGQLQLAIMRRVVDGCIIPWDMVPALRLYELLKAHTDFADTTLSTTTYVLAMNKTVYQKLPADLRKVIDDNSGQVAAGSAGAMWDLRAKAVADMVIGRGDRVITLAPEAVAHWRKTAAPVIDAWIKDMKSRKVDGAKLLAGARSLFEKYATLPEPQPPAPPQPVQQPAEAKVESKQPAQGARASPPPSSAPPMPAAPAPKIVPGPSSHMGAPAQAQRASVASPTRRAQQAPWWEFWRSAPPATASAAPRAAPASHWWQFWKSAPAPATASSTPLAPAVPPAPTLVPPVPAASPPVAAIAKPAPVSPPSPPKPLDIPL